MRFSRYSQINRLICRLYFVDLRNLICVTRAAVKKVKEPQCISKLCWKYNNTFYFAHVTLHYFIAINSFALTVFVSLKAVVFKKIKSLK